VLYEAKLTLQNKLLLAIRCSAKRHPVT